MSRIVVRIPAHNYGKVKIKVNRYCVVTEYFIWSVKYKYSYLFCKEVASLVTTMTHLEVEVQGVDHVSFWRETLAVAGNTAVTGLNVETNFTLTHWTLTDNRDDREPFKQSRFWLSLTGCCCLWEVTQQNQVVAAHWPSFLSSSSRWQSFCLQFPSLTGTCNSQKRKQIHQHCSGAITYWLLGKRFEHGSAWMFLKTHSRGVTEAHILFACHVFQELHHLEVEEQSMEVLPQSYTHADESNLRSQTFLPFWSEAEKYWVKIHSQDIFCIHEHWK